MCIKAYKDKKESKRNWLITFQGAHKAQNPQPMNFWKKVMALYIVFDNVGQLWDLDIKRI